MYKKIYKYMRYLCLLGLCAVTIVFLGFVYILLNFFRTDSAVMPSFSHIALGSLFFFALIYAICALFARKLAENIVNPVTSLKLSELSGSGRSVYPELASLVNKINAQGIEIERQLVKLKTRKTRFQAVSDNISEGLLTLDTDGIVLSVNNSGASILGINPDVAVHGKLSDIITDKKLLAFFYDACVGNRGFTSAAFGGRDYNVFFSPVFVSKRVRGIVMLIVDISEKEQSEALRKEFTANVSHELKTPLTTILGYSQIINRGIAKPEDILGFSRKIEKEASRLIALIDDIIKLSRLDEGVAFAEPQSFGIRSIAEEAVEALSSAAEARGITTEILGDNFTVTGDIQQISEMVYNLYDNAVKYNKENGEVKITLQNRSITVSDTGIGIPEEYTDRIFERFFRVDKSRSKSVNGTGLGLSIVKHIAETNHAEIGVESQIGVGTAITVRFRAI